MFASNWEEVIRFLDLIPIQPFWMTRHAVCCCALTLLYFRTTDFFSRHLLSAIGVTGLRFFTNTQGHCWSFSHHVDDLPNKASLAWCLILIYLTSKRKFHTHFFMNKFFCLVGYIFMSVIILVDLFSVHLFVF